ncbi:MAG: hypothetical protein NVV62_15550 [Terricaulis sp.]|nr:hypothetical protein [Terricaulis sp.]
MCNRYAADIRKAGKERDYWGFDEWSEARINPVLGNAVLEVFPKVRRRSSAEGGSTVSRRMNWNG